MRPYNPEAQMLLSNEIDLKLSGRRNLFDEAEHEAKRQVLL